MVQDFCIELDVYCISGECLLNMAKVSVNEVSIYISHPYTYSVTFKGDIKCYQISSISIHLQSRLCPPNICSSSIHSKFRPLLASIKT